MNGPSTLTVGSLFSGIGGIELGLERTGGFRTIWHCEIEPYPSAILAERWPGIPNLGDITKVDWSKVEKPDVLCGGFPCQDISNAGKRAGIGGKKSGLWKEYLRAIRELRPRYVLIENVAALVNRGLDVVLADLASLRYDAEWEIISAADVGAPHKRERIFVVGYLDRKRGAFHPDSENSESQEVADCEKPRLQAERKQGVLREAQGQEPASVCGWWEVEPNVGRVVDGVPRGLDSYIWRERIKALGNAVVPQCAERVGRAILRRGALNL